MAKLKTIEVMRGKVRCIINESDFNEKDHERIEDKPKRGPKPKDESKTQPNPKPNAKPE